MKNIITKVYAFLFNDEMCVKMRRKLRKIELKTNSGDLIKLIEAAIELKSIKLLRFHHFAIFAIMITLLILLEYQFSFIDIQVANLAQYSLINVLATTMVCIMYRNKMWPVIRHKQRLQNLLNEKIKLYGIDPKKIVRQKSLISQKNQSEKIVQSAIVWLIVFGIWFVGWYFLQNSHNEMLMYVARGFIIVWIALFLWVSISLMVSWNEAKSEKSRNIIAE